MKVTILKDGVTAKDEEGNIYKVKGITLKKDDGRNEIFYDNESKFYKVACPSDTVHHADLIKGNEIMLK
jgi:hypothetical protein